MAVAFAMILGCLPKNSLAAPKNNSLANEDNSLASGKPGSVGRAEQRSKKMSNSTKVSIGLTAGEIIWETVGCFFKIPTPGKGVARAVGWMFSDSKDKLKKKVNKPKKEVNKPITTIDELREAIRDFARIKKSNTTEEQKQIYKKIFKSLHKQYEKDKGELFRKFHENDENKFDKLGFGFKVISSNGNYWVNHGEKQDDKCVFIMKSVLSSDAAIRNILDENPQWKVLGDAAAKLKQEIVIGIGLHEDEYGPGYDKRLRGYISIGLKSDIEGNISNFTNGNFSIFDFTFYDKGQGINNLDELNNLK